MKIYSTATEKNRQAKLNILNLIGLIDLSVQSMLSSKEYSHEQKIFAYETVGSLYKMFLYDGNFGAVSPALFMLWAKLAREYAATGDKEKTKIALDNLSNYAEMADNLVCGRYTAMFLDGVEYSESEVTKNFEMSFGKWRERIRKEVE